MGANLCVPRETSPKRLRKQDHDDHVSHSSGIKVSIIKLMKQTCLCSSKKKKLNSQDQKLLTDTSQLTSLEEWISAALSFEGCSNGGHDFHVVKQFSNKVYPSLADQNHQGFASKSIINDGLRLQVEEVGEEIGVSSLSGKIKKRVSFRKPEVAQIIIFDISDEYS